MNEEVRKSFKKLLIQNLVINFMELPHVYVVVIIMYRDYRAYFSGNQPISQFTIYFLSFCDTWYAARGIVIPILRILIEPQLLL